jgi:hypothetical protein
VRRRLLDLAKALAAEGERAAENDREEPPRRGRRQYRT